VILTKGFFFVLQDHGAVVMNENTVVKTSSNAFDNTAFPVLFPK
jgi:hypothetical protein